MGEDNQLLKADQDTSGSESSESNDFDGGVVATDCNPFGDVCDLPESIYGAAMMVALLLAQGKFGAMHGVGATVFLGLVLNVTMQCYVLYCTMLFITNPAVRQVRALYGEYHSEVWPDGIFSEEAWDAFEQRERLCQMPFSQPLFFTAMLLTWTGTCMVDAKETMKYICLWWQLDKPSSTAHAVDLKKTEDGVMATSSSKLVKFLVITFVLIPKLLIAALLWWLGARWLSATPSFEDLVLNAVALAFITELDELIYNVLVPEDVQELVNTYKIKRPDNNEAADHMDDKGFLKQMRDRTFMWRMFNMVGSLVLVIGIPILYFRYFQQVLPHYKWDIHELCHDWLTALESEGEVPPVVPNTAAHGHAHHR